MWQIDGGLEQSICGDAPCLFDRILKKQYSPYILFGQTTCDKRAILLVQVIPKLV